MPSGTLISVEEYLATSYRPDCDYVDGRIEERNLGEWDHSKLHAAITAYFYQRRKTWNISVTPEQRVQVSPTRFRIPDVCVVLGEPMARFSVSLRSSASRSFRKTIA
jgi:Uma2 family endonuclease